jgi:hypothetical protein
MPGKNLPRERHALKFVTSPIKKFMLIQNYDFVFQLRESLVDLLGKASFYGELYPHYFPYTDKAFHDLGGGPRYIFIAPPSIQAEVQPANRGNFLKVSLPFRLSRPDDVEAMIDGVLEAEVGIVKEPDAGVPNSIRLDFGTLQFSKINSQQLTEVAENLSNADSSSKVLLLLMLGSESIDENGTIQFEELIQNLLIDFVKEEIGSIDISPALKELGRFDLQLSSVDYKVIDTQSPSRRPDALSLMLDFEGSPRNGDKNALSSMFSGKQNFGMGMSQRLAQSVVETQFANGNIPSVIDGVHKFPILISSPSIVFRPGEITISLHAKTQVQVDYLLWKTNHNISLDLQANFGLSIDTTGKPQVQNLNVSLSNISASGFLKVINAIFGPGKIKKALGDEQVGNMMNNLLDSTGLLKLTWDLPGEIPYKVKALANLAEIGEGELLLLGDAQLAHPDNSIFTPPAQYAYPPGPQAFVGMEGYFKKVRRLISSNSQQFTRPDREFSIWVPCTSSPPEAYAELPELQAAIQSGQCGTLRFRVHYELPWTRQTKKYENMHYGHYDAVLQFMPPGNLNLAWFLMNANELRKPSGSPLATGNSVDFEVLRPSDRLTDNAFQKKLVLRVQDSFGKTKYGSTPIEGYYTETITTEQVAAAELSLYQRELLLERLQKLSDELSKAHAGSQLPQAPVMASPTISLQGQLAPIPSEVEMLEDLIN